MTPLAHVENAAPLWAGLVFAVGQDLRSRRIGNGLNAAIVVAGLAMWAAGGGWHGLLLSGAGLVACTAIGVLVFSRGWLGAGDTKLLAAVGAWVGLPLVPVLVLSTAVAGGVVSLGTLALAGEASAKRGDILARPRAAQVPYALAIAAGAAVTAIMGGT